MATMVAWPELQIYMALSKLYLRRDSSFFRDCEEDGFSRLDSPVWVGEVPPWTEGVVESMDYEALELCQQHVASGLRDDT